MESADVRTHHLDTEDLEEEVAADGQPEEVPVGHIVARPVTGVHSRAHTVAAADDEGPTIFSLQELVGGDRGQMAIVGVHFLVLEGVAGLAEVVEVDVDGHHVDGLPVLDAVVLDGVLVAFEVAGLVHVQPHPRKRNQLVEPVQLVLPVRGSIGVQVVHEVHLPRPHSPDIVLVGGTDCFEESVHLSAKLDSGFVIDGHSGIN